MNTQDNERADERLVFIGGEGGLHRITASGDPEGKQTRYFFQTEDWRYSWADWDGMLDAATLERAAPISTGDVVGIAQLTADAEGRYVLDKDNAARGEYMAVIWSDGGEQKRLIIELHAERLPPETRAANWARIDAESRGAVKMRRQQEREAANMATVLDALNRHAEELRKGNELTALALRHAQKMEDVARAATQKPVDTAMDIYRRMPMDDEARAVREAILNLGSIRKAAKSLGMNYNRARNVVQKKILLAYAKAEIPPERAFLMRPSVGYRRTPQHKDDPINTERDLYQRGAEDMGENES